jgi:putative heme iron utilization protein
VLFRSGRAQPTASATAKARFLGRHASARTYADFPDFAMYALEIAGGHYIGGFGRIVDLAPAELVSDVADAASLMAAEGDIVSHMNADHADAVALYATVLARCAPGAWRMTGIDPGGFDLLHCSNAVRIEFSTPVRTPQDARLALVALAKQARAQRDAAPQ